MRSAMHPARPTMTTTLPPGCPSRRLNRRLRASLTAGRLVMGAFGERLPPDRILDAAVAGIVAGAILLWWSPTPALGAVGLLVIGFTEAAVFPRWWR